MKQGLRFDWYKKQDHSFLKPIPQSLIEDCTAVYTNKNAKRQEQLTDLILTVLSSLYSSYYTLPFGTRHVSYPLRSVDYKLNHRTKINFNHDYAKLLFQKLAMKGWIDVVDGRQGRSYTRIKYLC